MEHSIVSVGRIPSLCFEQQTPSSLRMRMMMTVMSMRGIVKISTQAKGMSTSKL